VALCFLYNRAREGLPLRCTVRLRRSGQWQLGRSAGGRRTGSGPRLGRKGEVGHLSHLDWKERWAGLDQNGLDEAGFVREEGWTRLQESLGPNQFGCLKNRKAFGISFQQF
jgi:hypothetical protein